MESGRCLKHAYAISIVVLLHISTSLSLFHHHANATRCVEREREALLAIKQDLVDKHDLLSSWGSGREAQKQDCCSWEGVYCDNQTGHVLRLDLGADPWQDQDGEITIPKILQGKISPKLIELLHLTYLDLSGNDFNGSQIPAFIGSLTSLRYLDLRWAGFGGQIPYQLGNLTHLQYLNLGEYDFTYSVENLNWLPHLSSLTYLDLSGTNLGNVFDWLETINKLPNLWNLTLSSCDLPPPILSTLSLINTSQSLAFVDVRDNNVTSSIFKWLCNYNTTLVHLELSSAGFGGQIPFHALGNLTHLQYLYLGEYYFPHSVGNLNWLPHLSSLKYLDLSDTNLSNVFDWMEAVNKLPNLRNLTLQSCDLPPPILSTLSHINTSQSLAFVDLRDNIVTSSIFKWLCNYNTTLVHLELSSAGFGGQIPFHALGNLTHLQYLHLGEYHFPHSVENLNWLPHLSSLKYLDLSDTNLDNVFDWLETVNKLPNLSYLNLWSCDLPPPILSSSFSYINSSKSLASVDLSNNNVTSSIFKWLCNFNTTLVHLDLADNKLSGSLPDVFGNMSSLTHLSLSDNQLEGGIPDSFAKLCGLKYLDISSNNLKGEIPNSVAKLCGLQYLQISYNNLSGHISNFFESSCAQNSLEVLDVSGNHLAGPFPADLTKFLALMELYLDTNQLSGTIPESIGQMSKLERISVRNNHLEGVISETHFSQLSKLQSLDLSSNSLVLDFHSEWVPPFQLNWLELNSCKMGPLFPKWLRTQKNLKSLAISDAGISDIIPSWFWDWSQNIEEMDMSRNAIKGTISADSGFELAFEPALNLSWNQLEGPIPSFLSKASSLDLSNNKLSKVDSFLCATKVSTLSFLDLSSNQVSGELPNCWKHFEYLVFLDLSNNTISGNIPTTMGSLCSIETLKLDKNILEGELPSSMKNCTSLILFDLGENKLSGLIPKWLGVGVSKLAILILRSNHFNGSMPSQLCHLTSIQVLDLSMNNISGSIPKCLNNLTTIAEKGNPDLTISHNYTIERSGNSSSSGGIYDDEISIIWKGILSKYKSTLGLVKSIDLSSNRLTGEIPREITDLVGLVSLNLARNHLNGHIPSDIGKLQSLESLDLSRNQIYGKIPTSLLQIYGLGYLNLSYNNLSGKIPIGTQLQNYDPSSFAGNPQLCGLPLERTCDLEGTCRPNVSSNQEDSDELITQGFYISLGLGFAVGFWGVCGSLIFKRSWRYAYYKFLNAANDWLYVKVALIRQKLKDVLN